MIIENFNVKRLYRPKLYSKDEGNYTSLNQAYNTDDGQAYNDAIVSAYQKGCDIYFSEAGISFDCGNASIKFLAPGQDFFSQDNNYSAVVMMQYYSTKFLFMGDAESEVEEYLIEKYGQTLKADVLKIAHHGSKSSTSEAFLALVDPDYAILSCSENSQILPNVEVISRLNEYGCSIFSTAEKDNFVVSVNQNKVVCEMQNNDFNYWTIVFAIVLSGVLILWKMPFFHKKEGQKN